MSRFFAGWTGFTFVAYSTTVEIRNRFFHTIERDFKSGSADAILMDNINTGDIILFSRRWYNYHIPTAAMIIFDKYFKGSEFDHGGVIVDNLGVPYLLERTPSGGVQCRKFEERIRHSKANQIILISAMPSAHLDSVLSEKNAFQYVRSKIAKQTDSEVTLYFKGLLQQLIFSNSRVVTCPSTALIFEFYKTLGYNSGEENCSLKNIFAREVELNIQHNKSCTSCANSINKSVTFSSQDTLIRTK